MLVPNAKKQSDSVTQKMKTQNRLGDTAFDVLLGNLSDPPRKRNRRSLYPKNGKTKPVSFSDIDDSETELDSPPR